MSELNFLAQRRRELPSSLPSELVSTQPNYYRPLLISHFQAPSSLCAPGQGRRAICPLIPVSQSVSHRNSSARSQPRQHFPSNKTLHAHTPAGLVPMCEIHSFAHLGPRESIPWASDKQCTRAHMHTLACTISCFSELGKL